MHKPVVHDAENPVTWRRAGAAVLAASVGLAALAASPWAAAQIRNDGRNDSRDDGRNDGRNPRNGDYIAAVVNQELVTAGEVERRLERAMAELSRAGGRAPNPEDLRRQALDSLIEERAIITTAREVGMRVDEAELDRAVQSIAAQNQVTMEVLRDRLRADGIEYARFRANLRDQIMIERLREREVYNRIKISEEDIDRLLEQQRSEAAANAEVNLAQILVTVPEGADPATLQARRQRAEEALARVRAGEAFEAVARAMSEDGNREKGGEIGMRPTSRLPDVFVEAARAIKTGEISAQLLRTGAGFHILKVLERKEAGLGRITQTRARHVLLRTSPQLTAEVASKRLGEYKREIESRQRSFEEVARQHSEDGSAASGGDLGWFGAGTMVPEFEAAMNPLPVGGLSDPVVSRFGVHLIQVLERREVNLENRQLREQARNVLREQRFEQAYLDWTKELRAKSYIEMREPPT
jgi:peptidyl-prolyl cis-trans isomerase SurA